ncbi:MAG TPA: alpha-galactosidase [Spirochaetes bacterium]|nr:alpha-galactosidase [Spirochaetota bacterium]
MAKIAIIGAGSIIFGTTLLNDLLQTEALEGSTYALMSPTMPRLKKVEDYTNKIIKKNNLKAEVYSTTDRRDALKDADYVVVVLQIGGMEAYKADYEIPLKYGVDQCLGQCVGPGGVFRGLRSIPVMAGIMHDMEELCPDALLLNYVNPMAATSIGMGMSSDIEFVGLCHGVQTTLDLIAGYTGVKKEEIDFIAAGINHMAWFLKIEKDGKDLYPVFNEIIEKPEYYINDKVRFEVSRHFGYFMTESTGHLSEYLPYFRKNQKALDLYCDQPAFGGESGAYYKYCDMIAKKFQETDPLSLESGDLDPRSKEYCSYIIESIETGKPFQFNGNVMNSNGYISNLPRGCCVEVPMYSDKHGLHAQFVGDLPSQLAALNQSNVTLQMLVAEAAVKGDPELAFAALAMDPLTAAVCTLKEIRDMTIELFEAHEQYLPQFNGRKPKKREIIVTTPETVGVDVPLDPALAIANRFGKLAE